MNLVHVLWQVCAKHTHKTAFIEKGRAVSYQNFCKSVHKISVGLETAGIGAGDRLLVLMPLSVNLYATLCAVWARGASVVMFDPSAGTDHIQKCLEELPVKAFIGNRKSSLLRWVCTPIRGIACALRVESLQKSSPKSKVHIAQVTADTPALVTFTSGSTAHPKAIVRTHGFLLKQHKALVACMPYHSDDIDLAVLPVFTLINLVEGITTVLPDDNLNDISKVNAAKLTTQIKRHNINRITTSPALLDRLCTYAAQRGEPLSSLRTVHVGGGPVFLDILERVEKQLPPRSVEIVYGSTEAEPISAIQWPDITAAQKELLKSGSGLLVGKPVGAIQVAIIRNHAGGPIEDLSPEAFTNITQPCGKAGEIVVAGEHVVQGYLRPEQNSDNKIFVGHTIWHRTGDCGRFDAEGNLWLLGRAGQILHHGNSELYPFAIESAIRAQYHLRSAVCSTSSGEAVLAIESTQLLGRIKKQYGSSFDRIVCVKKIPVDRRHASKVDYGALRRLL